MPHHIDHKYVTISTINQQPSLAGSPLKDAGLLGGRQALVGRLHGGDGVCLFLEE